MQDVSFNEISKYYDASREVPDAIIQKLLNTLREVGIVDSQGLLVAVACGTGIYLKPFAVAFSTAIGLDISKKILAIAKKKCEDIENVKFIVYDARSMNVPTETADLVISSKLFIHVRDWKQIAAEIGRITKAGKYFAYINESGLFNKMYGKKFREVCRESGIDFGFLGETDLDKTANWLEENGFQRIEVFNRDLEWNHDVTYAEEYEALEKRSFAEYQRIPDSDYNAMLRKTSEWIQKQPNGWGEKQRMSAKLRVDAFQKPGSNSFGQQPDRKKVL